MRPVLAGLLGLSSMLTIVSGADPASAQESGLLTTVTDLSDLDLDSGQGRDGREVAEGDDGDTITYTIVENPDSSGDATTAVIPDAPPLPDLSRVPGQTESVETTVAPPSGEPVSAPVADGPPANAAGDVTTADPAGSGTLVAACADFGSWYDAQVYYESVGGTAAGAELVTSLDSDSDGFACEELVEYS